MTNEEVARLIPTLSPSEARTKATLTPQKMNPSQYRVLLARLGLKPASKTTAAALRITVRTSQRYASGESPIPLEVQLRLLELNSPTGDLPLLVRRILSEGG